MFRISSTTSPARLAGPAVVRLSLVRLAAVMPSRSNDQHLCPGPGCEKMISDDLLACQRHWFQVPKDIRDAVYAAWDHRRGLGSDEHALAVHEALKHMRA